MTKLDVDALRSRLDELSRLLTEAAERAREGANADALAARRIHDRAAADLVSLGRERERTARLRAAAPALRGLTEELADVARQAGPWAEPLAKAAQGVVRSAATDEAGHQPTLVVARNVYLWGGRSTPGSCMRWPARRAVQTGN